MIKGFMILLHVYEAVQTAHMCAVFFINRTLIVLLFQNFVCISDS